MNLYHSFRRGQKNSLNIILGSFLGDMHIVEDFLGEGTFGVVTKCCNTEKNEMVAIKVNKNYPYAIRSARREIDNLKQLRSLDPDTCNIVRWNGSFFDKDRICLSFELLDQSLYSYMEDRNFCGLPMTELRSIIQQVATALCYLRTIGIVHADLKLENVMVVDRRQKPLKVKLSDFGLGCHVFALEPGFCVQTIYYRAPEVMLHIPFNEAIDMWSLGIVAAELAIGYSLYPGEKDYDMLRFIIETQGQPADYVLDRGMGTHFYFQQLYDSQQHWRFLTPEEYQNYTGVSTKDTRHIKVSSLDELERVIYTQDRRDKQLLVDLIKGMLQLDPDLRLIPQEVLQHPFLHSQSQCSIAPLAAETEEETTEEAHIQLQNNAQNDGRFRRFFRMIKDAFNSVLQLFKWTSSLAARSITSIRRSIQCFPYYYAGLGGARQREPPPRQNNIF